MRLILTIWSFDSSSSARGSVGRRCAEPVLELEAVAHLEAVDQDVDRPVAGDVDEVGLLATEQRVVALVRGVALAGEELVEGAAILAARREVEVDLHATRPRGPIGRVRPDRHPAHQPDEQALRVGEVHDPQRLGQRVLERSRVAEVARASGHGPPSTRTVAGKHPTPDRQGVYVRVRHANVLVR